MFVKAARLNFGNSRAPVTNFRGNISDFNFVTNWKAVIVGYGNEKLC